MTTTPPPQPTSGAPTLARLLALLVATYLFMLGIGLLGDAFQALGTDTARSFLEVTANPIVGLFMGILATSLVQSSSTTTTMVVALVAAGQLQLEWAVPMIMGANIGTTVTNTVVSFGHVCDRAAFRRAYAGAILDDVFNLLAVAVLLPLQMWTNFLGKSSAWLAEKLHGAAGLGRFDSPLKTILDPVSETILAWVAPHAWIGVVVAALCILAALMVIVRQLEGMMLSRVSRLFEKTLFRNTAVGLTAGFALTALLQSSSVTLSLAVPLLGVGAITVRQMLPYAIGANVGTTMTALFAAIVTGSEAALAVACAHLLFNLLATAVFLPLKRIPIGISEVVARLAERQRALPVAIVVVVFFLVPGALLVGR